tara:strand:- start:390 stop:602 length:213 start_codon:yes stop_codon:yes gene_type:complete
MRSYRIAESAVVVVQLSIHHVKIVQVVAIVLNQKQSDLTSHQGQNMELAFDYGAKVNQQNAAKGLKEIFL